MFSEVDCQQQLPPNAHSFKQQHLAVETTLQTTAKTISSSFVCGLCEFSCQGVVARTSSNPSLQVARDDDTLCRQRPTKRAVRDHKQTIQPLMHPATQRSCHQRIDSKARQRAIARQTQKVSTGALDESTSKSRQTSHRPRVHPSVSPIASLPPSI